MSGPVISADYSLGTDDVINYSCPVSNGTPPVPKLFFSTTYRVVGLLISVPVFLIGVIGNILVIYVVLSSTKMKTPINYYLVSLSLADLLVMLCATAPFFAELFLVVERWVLSRPMCPILVSLQYLSANASALSIMAFSVERYQAVCHPIKSKVSSKGQRAKRIILGVWSFCIVYNSMWLYLTSTSVHPLRTGECIVICHFSFKRSTYATIYMLDLICFYCIPLLITCVLYILIARAIFRSGHFRQASTNKACTVKCVRRLTRDKVKVVKMVAIVVVLFAVLWLPYRGMVVYNSFSKTRFENLWYLLFARTMVFINSSVNPILYNAMSRNFRYAFRRILTCREFS